MGVQTRDDHNQTGPSRLRALGGGLLRTFVSVAAGFILFPMSAEAQDVGTGEPQDAGRSEATGRDGGTTSDATRLSDTTDTGEPPRGRTTGREVVPPAVDDWRQRAETIKQVAASISEEAERDSYSEAARRALRREAALATARAVVSDGLASGLEEEWKSQRPPADTPDAGATEDASAPSETALQEEARREELREAERKAREEMEAARKAEEAERDAQIRDLIGRRRDILESVADLAAKHATRVQELGEQRSSLADAFSRTQERLEQEYRALPKDPTANTRRDEIDPFFDKLREHLEEARGDYLRVTRELQTAVESVDRAQARMSSAERAYANTRARFRGVEETDVGAYRLELARTQRNYAQRQLAMREDVASGWRRLVELHQRRVEFYRGMVESLLPRVSERKWDAFFSPWRESNWAYAQAALRETLSGLEYMFHLRWEAFQKVPDKLSTVSFWGWLIGLLWRLAVIPLVMLLIQRYRQPAVRRLVDVLLGRAFFRRRADLTIKFVEVLASVVWPLALYGMVRLVAGYLAGDFPEARAVIEVADVGVIYLAVMSVVKVLVLTRSVRERLGRLTPAPSLGRWSDRAGHRRRDVVDVVDLEEERSRKLIRSARRLLIFVLVDWFVPGWTAEIVGYNLIWWTLSVGIDWAALVILLIELRVWREEIAAGFEQIAGQRAAGIAGFVKRHQDRFYGVFLIAVASVVLLVGEIVVLVRRHLVDWEWSQRVGNFLFRKRIELQQRDQEGEGDKDVDPMDLSRLPDAYRERFADEPLFDEPYIIERGWVEKIWDQIDRWRHRRKKGAVALSGEAGIGKSTVVNQVYRRLVEDHVPVTYTQVTDKLVTHDSMRRFVTHLFDLEAEPRGREEMIEAVRNAPSRIILLDVCHHMYFRRIGGFRALARFLDLVNLTDDRHFWLLTFNKFSWRYLDRVQEQKHFFGETVELDAWSDEELQSLVNRRNETLPYSISFQELVVTHDEQMESYYEVVQTANGYFRLLEEFCDGNPSVAIAYWLRNLSVGEDENVLNVSLFRKPTTEPFDSLTDNHLFALTALAQHGELHPDEIAEIINAEPGFCQMAMTHFEQVDIVRRMAPTGRYALTSLYFKPVVNHLANSNFLWM